MISCHAALYSHFVLPNSRNYFGCFWQAGLHLALRGSRDYAQTARGGVPLRTINPLELRDAELFHRLMSGDHCISSLELEPASGRLSRLARLGLLIAKLRLLVAQYPNGGFGRFVRVARAAGIGVELPDRRPVCRGTRVHVRPELGQFTASTLAAVD
jgi:hypothetical protein